MISSGGLFLDDCSVGDFTLYGLPCFLFNRLVLLVA